MLTYISGTPDQCINELSRALVDEGVDEEKAYSTVKQIYADPDQSDPGGEWVNGKVFFFLCFFFGGGGWVMSGEWGSFHMSWF